MKKVDLSCSILVLLFLLWTGIYCFSNQFECLKESVFNITFPSTLEQLETFCQDQNRFRNQFLEQAVTIKKILGVREHDQIYFGNNGYLLEKPKKIEQEEKVISAFNQFYQTHNDITMSLIFLPSHITINPTLVDQDMPIFDEYEQMKRMYHKIAFNTIDVVPILKEGMREYPVYYHLDSHVTSYGAYYIYQKFSQLNDLTSLAISDFDIREVTDQFVGDLVKRTHTYSWNKDSMVVFKPKKEPRLEVRYEQNVTSTLYDESQLSYSYFLGKKEPWLQIINFDIPSNSPILIVKDESANAIIPFFTNHYSNIHVIDIDYYQQSISDYIHQNKEIREIIFLFDMNR